MRNFDQLNIDVLNRPISIAERILFNSRINDILHGRANLLYRGESKESLQQKIAYGFPCPFSDMLFLIGDKGRNFLSNINDEYRSAEKRYINDVSNEYFKEIFHMIHDLLDADLVNIRGFNSQNPVFAQFFLNPNNIAEFITRLESLTPHNKLKARDYYLTLLHSHSNSEYYPNSRFVSTTRNEGIAEIFQGKGADPNDKVVFYLWMPWSDYSQFAIRFSYLEKIYAELLTAQLPVYFNRFFHQEEITLKGGILPHYLVGFSYFNDGQKRFSVNPNFIKNNIGEDWINEGMRIDQSDFWNTLKKTAYKGAFMVDGNGVYYEIETTN